MAPMRVAGGGAAAAATDYQYNRGLSQQRGSGLALQRSEESPDADAVQAKLDPSASASSLEFVDTQKTATRIRREITDDLAGLPGQDVDYGFVDSYFFHTMITLAVLMNTLQMGVEADHPKWEIWPYMEYFYTIIFTAEAILKVHVYRLDYFRCRFNLLDFFLVLMALVDILLTAVSIEADLQMLSIMRVLRLIRVIRILKLMKECKRLFLVVESVVAAIESTMWVALVCGMALYVSAIFVRNFLNNVPGSMERYPGYRIDVEDIYETEMMQNFNPHLAFGTMLRSMLTLFNMAMVAEWVEVVRPVYEVQPALVPFFVIFVLIMAFAIMNVIIAMIVDAALENAHRLQEEEKVRLVQKKLQMLRSVQDVVTCMDKDENGAIDLKELSRFMEDPNSVFNGLLHDQELQLHLPVGFSAEELLITLDVDGDRVLEGDEFVSNFYRMVDGGPFQHICMVQMSLNSVRRQMRETKEIFCKRLESLDEKLTGVLKASEKTGCGVPVTMSCFASDVLERLAAAVQRLEALRLDPAEAMMPREPIPPLEAGGFHEADRPEAEAARPCLACGGQGCGLCRGREASPSCLACGGHGCSLCKGRKAKSLTTSPKISPRIAEAVANGRDCRPSSVPAIWLRASETAESPRGRPLHQTMPSDLPSRTSMRGTKVLEL